MGPAVSSLSSLILKFWNVHNYGQRSLQDVKCHSLWEVDCRFSCQLCREKYTKINNMYQNVLRLWLAIDHLLCMFHGHRKGHASHQWNFRPPMRECKLKLRLKLTLFEIRNLLCSSFNQFHLRYVPSVTRVTQNVVLNVSSMLLMSYTQSIAPFRVFSNIFS